MPDYTNPMEALIVTSQLAEYFQVPYVRVQLGKRSEVSYYRPDTETIVLANPTFNLQTMDYENAILHEFSHHLAWYRAKRNNEKLPYHDKRFTHALIDVVHKHYNGSINRYPWTAEYKRVQDAYSKWQNTIK